MNSTENFGGILGLYTYCTIRGFRRSHRHNRAPDRNAIYLVYNCRCRIETGPLSRWPLQRALKKVQLNRVFDTAKSIHSSTQINSFENLM